MDINYNLSLGIHSTGYNFARQDEIAAQSKPEQKTQQKENDKKQIQANDVLEFMASSKIDMVPIKSTKEVDVNKYVTTEQAERIAAFVKGYEADYDEAVKIAVDEFNISGNVANDIALAYINASY